MKMNIFFRENPKITNLCKIPTDVIITLVKFQKTLHNFAISIKLKNNAVYCIFCILCSPSCSTITNYMKLSINSCKRLHHNKTLMWTSNIKPAHTTKFSLTSSLVALLAPVYNGQVFPRNFSLISFVWSCVQHKLTSFFLTIFLVQKLVMPAFEQVPLSRKNLSNYAVHTSK